MSNKWDMFTTSSLKQYAIYPILFWYNVVGIPVCVTQVDKYPDTC